MNNCSGATNREPRLVGMLNNSVLGGGGTTANDMAELNHKYLKIGKGMGTAESSVNKDRTFTIWNAVIGPGSAGSYTWRNDVAIRSGCTTNGMSYDKIYTFASDKGFYASSGSSDSGANRENGLNLGNAENPWGKLYLGEMQLSYNDTDRCIEFLVE